MIKTLLIANRGEIACRIIKTAKKMGIECYAIFSDVDANALHVKMANHAFYIGPAPSKQSYLQRDKIIALAKQHQINAIHPGYGFLAEDSEFADMCEKAGIIFVGPSAKAIKAMGDKALAKDIMQNAGVPVVPGYQGEKQNYGELSFEADKIGYPILIKAAAGGGGKGMRLVLEKTQLKVALAEAKQEAKSSFDNDEILLEKYILPARHIEVQIFSDTHGKTVYLFDRDCSIQRRHQKIIEEAPAPNLSAPLRAKMGETAVKAAQAINYVGAGTIEFLVTENNEFYFMEMNTRLQVEHPITEMITCLDLVEWQLKVADGEPLPLKQDQITQQGHAIETRIYAENPYNNFIPAIGTLDLLHFPPITSDTRIDSGVTQGDRISPYYDPLIAKLIVWSPTREQAIHKIQEALLQTYIIGVENNVSFLISLLQQEDFQKIKLHTRFIDEHQAQLFAQDKSLRLAIIAIATVSELGWRKQNATLLAETSIDVYSPWFYRDHWRLNSLQEQTIRFWHLENAYAVDAEAKNDMINLNYDGSSHQIQFNWRSEIELMITINGVLDNAAVVHKKNAIYIFYKGKSYHLQLTNPNAYKTKTTGQETQFIAPMPSTVVEICIESGQKVAAGEKLMVLEAMKMQHTIFAPEAGKIKSVNFNVGDLLNEGATLLEFEKLEG